MSSIISKWVYFRWNLKFKLVTKKACDLDPVLTGESEFPNRVGLVDNWRNVAPSISVKNFENRFDYDFPDWFLLPLHIIKLLTYSKIFLPYQFTSVKIGKNPIHPTSI